MLALLCDFFTPFLLLALLALPWFYAGRLAPRPLIKLIAAQTAVGITATYCLLGLDLFTGFWPRWGLDYSTHSAFACSLALPLINLHHWGWSCVLVLYGFCMNQLDYHTWADIASTCFAWASVCLPFIYWLHSRANSVDKACG